MILLTTSRRPTKDIRTFCRDLSHTIPNVLIVNRGKLSLEGVAEKAIELNAEKVMIVNRWKGGPGKIEMYKLSTEGLLPIPPLIYLRNVKLRRGFPQVMRKGRRIKSVALEASPNPSIEVEKLKEVFSKFFNIPPVSFEEAQGNYDALMRIKAEPSEGLTITVKILPEMVEIGPRMSVSHLIWDLTYEG
ncbi:MAG: Brix domain-containing protein [Candidatus Bathycorpusculaceae bacterium]